MGLQVVQQQTPVLDDQAMQGNACSCWSSLCCHFGCDSSSSTEALIVNVRAQLAASTSLRAVLAAAASSAAGKGVGAV